MSSVYNYVSPVTNAILDQGKCLVRNLPNGFSVDPTLVLIDAAKAVNGICPAIAAESPYVGAAIVLTSLVGGILLARYTSPAVAATVEASKSAVQKALDIYNNGGIRNNLKSRVAFAKIALSATGHAIANIIKTIFFAITGINKNRRDSMRINAKAAVVEIKLATLANLGVIAPSLAQRIQNRA